MGETKAIHGGWINHCWPMLVGPWLDSGNSWALREKPGHGKVGERNITYGWSLTKSLLQKSTCTIALAILSIYAVDFAINAGIPILPQL